MTSKKPFDFDSLFNDEDDAVINAIRKGTREAMKIHIAFNVPMASWENGKCVEIPPEELAQMLETWDSPGGKRPPS
ncbi:MAG: hypothetical protein LBW85_06195 [Deltaproteobacteria bacterium]|nr:hypothetical protein [Deltaproteobacteria bacterium]